MISNMSYKPVFSPLPPEPPTALSATAVSENQIELVWCDNSTHETGYIIERSSDQTTWSIITKTLANITTYSDPGLTCGATHYYRFTGYNNAGQVEPELTKPVPPPVVEPELAPETTENSVRPRGTETPPVGNPPCPTDRHLNIHIRQRDLRRRCHSRRRGDFREKRYFCG